MTTPTQNEPFTEAERLAAMRLISEQTIYDSVTNICAALRTARTEGWIAATKDAIQFTCVNCYLTREGDGKFVTRAHLANDGDWYHLHTKNADDEGRLTLCDASGLRKRYAEPPTATDSAAAGTERKHG